MLTGSTKYPEHLESWLRMAGSLCMLVKLDALPRRLTGVLSVGDPVCSPSLAIALSSMLNRLKALLPFMLGVRAIIDNRFAA
jgi:hypothetical protein